jgi:hypothetical protein
LTVFVVNVESLKATSLIHAGKFPKLQNLTTTSSTTTEESASSSPTKEKQQEVLDGVPDEEVSFIYIMCRSNVCP